MFLPVDQRGLPHVASESCRRGAARCGNRPRGVQQVGVCALHDIGHRLQPTQGTYRGASSPSRSISLIRRDGYVRLPFCSVVSAARPTADRRSVFHFSRIRFSTPAGLRASNGARRAAAVWDPQPVIDSLRTTRSRTSSSSPAHSALRASGEIFRLAAASSLESARRKGRKRCSSQGFSPSPRRSSSS